MKFKERQFGPPISAVEKYGRQAFAFEIMETVERQPEKAQVAYARGLKR
ncbi:MAG: hypothetical protein ACLUO4_01710 [Christensenellales bacterium]